MKKALHGGEPFWLFFVNAVAVAIDGDDDGEVADF